MSSGTPGQLVGHLEAEELVLPELALVQLTVQGRVQEGPGVVDADALPDAEGPAGPPRVDEPTAGAVGLHLLLQHVGVHEGVVDHEGRAEAGAEGDLRLRAQADLRSGDLGGVAADEVVQGLIRGEPGDGRKDPRGVAGEEEDVLRMGFRPVPPPSPRAGTPADSCTGCSR